MAIEIPCPTCKKKIPYSLENPFRPFCSQRCRLVDLGAWLEQDYVIPAQNPNDLPEDQ